MNPCELLGASWVKKHTTFAYRHYITLKALFDHISKFQVR